MRSRLELYGSQKGSRGMRTSGAAAQWLDVADALEATRRKAYKNWPFEVYAV